MKLLPNNVGVQATFLDSFVKRWRDSEGIAAFAELNAKVIAGVYENTVDEFLKSLRKLMEYHTATFFLDTLFRYPFVCRTYGLAAGKVITRVSFKLDSHFDPLILDTSLDAFGAQVFRMCRYCGHQLEPGKLLYYCSQCKPKK